MYQFRQSGWGREMIQMGHRRFPIGAIQWGVDETNHARGGIIP